MPEPSTSETSGGPRPAGVPRPSGGPPGRPDGPLGSEAPGPHDLERLVASVAAGESDALGRLYDRTVAMVYTLAERLVRDPFVAEEAVLDVYRQV